MADAREAVPVLGYADGTGDVIVDLDRLITGRMLVQANSGGGKSRALRHLLEQTHGRVQHLVLDPEGEFASLREQFPYVLAGREGDVPTDPRSAKLLCRRLVELGASAVIDLYDLTLADRRKFVRLFLDELLHLPRALWRPLLVVIDEAHVFAPERGSGESESTEAVITLCTQGRKRGYCAVLATQRLSKLHKDAAAELLNKMIGRTGLDVDVKRAGDDLGFDKEQRQTLKSLTPGTFYTYGPAIAGAVTLVRTGAVVTSHPEAGRVSAPPPPAPAAVQALLGELRDLPQRAEEEARTVADLERQVRDLRTQLRRAQSDATGREAAAPDPAAVERAVTEAVARATKELTLRHEHQLRELTARLGPAVADLRATADALDTIDGRVRTALDAPAPAPSAPVGVTTVAPVERWPERRETSARSASVTEGVKVSAPQQRILDALATFHALGIDQVSRSNVAVFADQSPRSSGYANNLGALRSTGLIDYPAGGVVALTAAGHDSASRGLAIATLEDLHRAWGAQLPRPQWSILEPLIRAYPAPIERSELAALAEQSPTSSGYANNLGALRGLRLLDYKPGRLVMATALLFPEGLR